MWTTDELVATIRLEGRIPDGVPDYPDAVILGIADRVTSTYLVDVLQSLRNGYLVKTYETPIVAGQQEYTIPARASGDALEGVYVVDTGGVEHFLAHLPISDRGSFYLSSTQRGTPTAFCIQDSSVVLLPPPDGVMPTLRVRYTQRRAKLVPVSECALVQEIDAPDFELECGSQPFGADYGGDLDVVRDQPPFLTPVTVGVFAVGTGPAPISFLLDGDTDMSLIEVGDYLCLPGETCVVQLPVELHWPLALLSASQIMRQMGYSEASLTAKEEGLNAIQSFKNMAAPRAKEQLFKVVNRGSLLRSRSVWRT